MDPSQSLPPTPPNQDGLVDKISESSGTFVKNNYESFLRRAMGVVYSVIGFIKSSIINIISQVINKE